MSGISFVAIGRGLGTRSRSRYARKTSPLTSDHYIIIDILMTCAVRLLKMNSKRTLRRYVSLFPSNVSYYHELRVFFGNAFQHRFSSVENLCHALFSAFEESNFGSWEVVTFVEVQWSLRFYAATFSCVLSLD